MFDFWRFKEVSSFKVGSCLIGDYLLFLFGICIWFLILRWSQHARFEAKSGSKAQSRAGCLKVASLVFCCHSRLFHVLLHYMVGVCHAQRWICRVNLPVQLLSKLMCFYNHGISPLGSWMIVWFQYLSIFAIKATCIRHVSDCFLWSKKVRFGFMLSLSLCNGVGKHLNKIHKILWFLLFVSQRYACKKTMYHLHHSYHWFNLPNGNLFQ